VKVHGLIRVPGDKSISHRALMLAALAEGTSCIRGILPSADVHSTAGALRSLGVSIPPLAPEMVVRGRGSAGLKPPAADLDCGNSGTTTRLLAGIAAARPFASRFVGDASLSRRPMRRVAEPLSAMGARFEFERGDGLPMVIHGGPLKSIRWTSETASAQVKSAILLAGVAAHVPVVVREPARSRDHTERMLRALGAEVEALGTIVRLEPPDRLAPLDISVPADPSSAAFMAALAVLASDGGLTIPDVCLNPTRTGFFRVLQRMGARLEVHPTGQEGGEDVGVLYVWPSELAGVTLGADDVPSMIDELPLLACLATRANGETRIQGAHELRVKESDRIATVVANLRALGAEVEEHSDGMTVIGTTAPLRGRVVTRGDHRIAMAFGVLAALPRNEIEIDDPGCVSVSYPAFWEDLRAAVAG
jgi:3-phosphoshikimate 1-carboxyvinyltransferase